VRTGDWHQGPDGVVAGGVALAPGEYELVLRPRDESESRTLPGEVGVVTLDLTVDPVLESEGLARDAVRMVQAARRQAGLHVSDCVALDIDAPPDMAAAVETHRAYVAAQTLAVGVTVTVAAAVSIRVTKAPCS